MAHLFLLDSNPEIILRLLQDLKQIKSEKGREGDFERLALWRSGVLIREMAELSCGSWDGVSAGWRLWPSALASSNLLSLASGFGFPASDNIRRL